MLCPHCQEYLEAKAEKLSVLTKYETYEIIDVMICRSCDTFIGVYYKLLNEKIDSIANTIDENTKTLSNIAKDDSTPFDF